MLATRDRATDRRGIVLVLVLAMLGLLALIAVTFAAFAGQAKINTRNFAMSVFKPQADELFDFALSQLIGDTSDIRSVIRGHSMARDMYGNDASNNGYLSYGPSTGQPLLVTNVAPNVVTVNGVNVTYYTLTTNILSSDPGFYGYNFTRWVIRMTYTGGLTAGMVKPVDQTFEILTDNVSNQYRTFLVTPITSTDTFGNPTALYNPTLGTYTHTVLNQFMNPTPLNTNTSNLAYYPFVLDGRYLRAFNGTGLSAIASPSTGVPESYYGNFRFNPDGMSPNQFGMDEDYDACDLDNWFLAIQSADGQVMIPSFHRPAIIRYDTGAQTGTVINDWQPLNTSNGFSHDSAARILRPIQNLGNDAATFPDLHPDPTGKITYDVDNDGDGLTDSVWLDLGYPARRDSRGKLYKPLFAFMVIGLNGRIPLNTAGNLACIVGGVPNTLGVNPPNTIYGGSGQAVHLGNSTGEIDPMYALQNALNSSASDPIFAFFPAPPALSFPVAVASPADTQVDSGGIDVRLTQLRNILAGTRPQQNPTPGIGGAISAYNTAQATNGDLDVVLYSTGPTGGQQPYFMPNGIATPYGVGGFSTVANDSTASDSVTGLPYVIRKTAPVPGRWGEATSIPGIPFANPSTTPTSQFLNVVTPFYNDPARAGYSQDIGDVLNGTPRDAADDNFNAFDPYPLGHTGEVGDTDFYDASGGLMLPIDRIRRFVTPMDINGTGTLSDWGRFPSLNRNRGSDSFGRVQYSSYFRPAGSPGYVVPGVIGTVGAPSVGAVTYPWALSAAYAPDVTSNLLHGFESFRFPNTIRMNIGGGSFDLPNVQSATNPFPTTFPTYDVAVNTRTSSDGVNEAEEMNLYTFNPLLDSPYGPTDLEWLYRQQDVDGSTLTSRLSQLAPISLTNGLDGQRRRRLFAIDAFESNRFAWTNDNPAGAFPNNSTFFFTPASSYNAQTTIGNVVALDASMYQLQQNANFAYGNNNVKFYPTPSLAQGDHKINLNMPFPVSNDCNEAVRQKWINDVYQLMKVVLPPRAVDTPEELAQLSQYIINIVDFRDPDATMTHWVNPDVVLSSPLLGLTGTPPAPNMTTPPMTLLPASSVLPTTSNTMVLDQYGKEYDPVAINEAILYQYSYQAQGAGLQIANRFMIELVNTQVQAGTMQPTQTSPLNGQLDLGGYNPTSGNPYGGGAFDLVFTADDPYSRPDPYRGELPVYGNTYALTPLNSDSFLTTYPNGSGTPFASTSSDVVLMPLTANPTLGNNIVIPPSTPTINGSLPTNYFYVFGNSPPSATSTQGTKTTTAYYEAGPLMPGVTYAQASTAPASSTYGNGYVIPTATGAGGAPGVGIPAVLQTLNQLAGFDPVTPGSVTPAFLTNPSNTLAGVLPNPIATTGTTSVTTTPYNYVNKIPQLNIATTAGAQRASQYYWVCLRRPANPFAPVSATNPMRVIDSMRVPYIDGTGTNITKDTLGNPAVNGIANTIYSVQRFQPYRGGHAVPVWNSAGAAPPTTTPSPIDTRYGYSEQIVSPTTNSLQSLVGANFSTPLPQQITQGIYYSNNNNTVNNPATGYIYHTFGLANENEIGSGAFNPENWDYFPFHDRDFSSVAELMLVPASAPGLFTKQFAEFAPSLMNITNIFSQITPLTTPGSLFQFTLPTMTANSGSPINGQYNPAWAGPTPGSTALGGATSSPFATASTPFWYASQYTTGANTAIGTFTPPIQPHTFPYLSDRFFYTGFGAIAPTSTLYPNVNPNYDTSTIGVPGPGVMVGGNGADGWFKMFEFLEVPTPMIGGIGPIMNGTNFDWSRQDSRPGQLNLNLIIDEEVFLSLLGKQTINQTNGLSGLDQFSQTSLNFDQIGPLPAGNYGPNGTYALPLPAGSNPIPMVVTSTLSNGSPGSAYPMAAAGASFTNSPAVASYSNPAMTAFDPISNSSLGTTALAASRYTNGLKASWVQFLNLRHGGSGYLFGYGVGGVGQNSSVMPLSGTVGAGLPAEIPFHSLSYPDINYTVMRPAALPPTTYTNPPVNNSPVLTATGSGSTYYSGDPGVRAPEVLLQNGTTAIAFQGFPSSAFMGTYQYPIASANPLLPNTTGTFYPYPPPPIPARRLFQTPDSYAGNLPPGVGASYNLSTLNLTQNAAPSNASETGDPTVNNAVIPLTTSTLATPGVLPPISYTPFGGGIGTFYAALTDAVPSLYWPTGIATGNPARYYGTAASYYTPPVTPLTAPTTTTIFQDGTSGTPTPGTAGTLGTTINSPSLGSSFVATPSTYLGTDYRQHPFWRSEEMQRVMNLTTVRTHQYAVWVTIGFFEVTRQGDLGMASSATPWLAYDIMGPEIRATAGTSTRFRQFALVDRLRLSGFNPTAAGQFQSAVVYRKRIQ